MNQFKYDIALKTAWRFHDILKPHCHLIHVAGSIRRKKAEVKDIEIVCYPKREIITDESKLFQEQKEIISPDFVHALATITAAVIKGNPEGRYMQIRTTSTFCPGIYLDLFMPVKEDYYRQLVIRTGSADYVHNYIAAAWKRKGWVGTGETGLRRIEDCEAYKSGDKTKYRLKTPPQGVGGLPPAWSSELDFFQWLGIDWVDPELRELHTLNPAQ